MIDKEEKTGLPVWAKILIIGVLLAIGLWTGKRRSSVPALDRLQEHEERQQDLIDRARRTNAEEAARIRADIRVGIPATGVKPPHVTAAEEAAEREPSYTDGVEAAIEKRRQRKAEEAAQAEKEAAEAERLGAPDAADKRAKANELRKEADRLKEEAAPAETAPK